MASADQQAITQAAAQSDPFSLKPLASAKVFASRLSQVQLPPLNPEISVEEVTRHQQVGAAMLSSKREARWLKTGTKGPLSLGEEMLSEQQALDDRVTLLRKAQSDDQSMRLHITGNIACRLKQELKTQGQEALSMQQKCLNIKKNLADMTAFRRELSGLKSQVEMISGEVNVKNSDDTLKELGKGFALCKRELKEESNQWANHPFELEVRIRDSYRASIQLGF